MNSLVTIHENIPVVSHRSIAQNVGVEQRALVQLISNHQSDFEEFGTLTFKMEGVVNNGKGEQPKTYLLNEQQATLLMTYMKNSPVVRELKKALVRAFFDLRERVQSIPAPSIFTRLIDLRDPLWREALYMGYNGKCFYTGKCLNFDAFHVDHVLPQSRGGMDTLDNLVLCDPSYNMSKQAIVVSEMELNGYRQRIIVEFAPKVVALYESKRSGIVADGVSVNTLMNPGMMKALEKMFGSRSVKKLYAKLIPVLDTPEAIEDQHKDHDDDLAGFIECYLVPDPHARSKSRDVYEAYMKWCTMTNVEPLKMMHFTYQLKQYEIGKDHRNMRIGEWQGAGFIGFTVAPMGGAL